jgi:AcrR family transcriptional regulator
MRIRKVPRRRRTPEVARQELLDAAERGFARAHPEQVGLKDVASEAGTSHALITHYFGTYAGLVEAALERRTRRLRERIIDELRAAGAIASPGELLGMLFAALSDPVHLRLLKWRIAHEGATVAAFALQDRGLALVAREVAGAIAVRATPAQIEKIELALATAVAAALGYATSRPFLASAIGRVATPELDAQVQATLAGMLAGYLAAELGEDFREGSTGAGH